MILECSHYLFIFVLCFNFVLAWDFILILLQFHGILLTMCFLNAVGCFMYSNLSLLHVLTHSTAKAPLFYQIATTWSNHEGSLLLWCWLLALIGLLCCIFPYFIQSKRILTSRHSKVSKIKQNRIGLVQSSGGHRPMLVSATDVAERSAGLWYSYYQNKSYPIYCICYYYAVMCFFGIFLISTSNPFLKNQFLSIESIAELNPVLQDPILAIHPPCIYIGYVATAICFSFAFPCWAQTKISKRLWNTSWKFLRFWLCVCWSALTIGILLGSWWAYHELGWGGWWFWDPVENASLMPWLFSTACIHSILLPRLNILSLFFNLFVFVLSILATFFVRSGLLASVHSFATDSTRGLFLLFLFLSIFFISIYSFVREIVWLKRKNNQM